MRFAGTQKSDFPEIFPFPWFSSQWFSSAETDRLSERGHCTCSSQVTGFTSSDPVTDADACGRCPCCLRSAAPPYFRLCHTPGKIPPFQLRPSVGCTVPDIGKSCACLVRHQHLVGSDC